MNSGRESDMKEWPRMERSRRQRAAERGSGLVVGHGWVLKDGLDVTGGDVPPVGPVEDLTLLVEGFQGGFHGLDGLSSG